MINKFNLADWADRYVSNELTAEEMDMLHLALDNDVILQKEWDETLAVLQLLKNMSKHENVKNHLSQIEEKRTPNKVIQFIQKNWKTASIAACIGILTSTFTAAIMNNDDSSAQNAQFTQLKREIAHIKNSQFALKETVNSNNKSDIQEENYTGGTGFALTQHGYIATNYHVVKDAQNITVQCANQKEYQAHLVAFDSNSDVAIIKVDDADFKFEGKIPYTLQKNSSLLGAKIFTLGYPQDNLTYNEGYISSMKGYKNDTLSYQLEITSNPGQSGSPVLDKNGYVIGIIVGKKTDTYGTTYAKHTSSIIDLVNSLPADQSVKINSTAPVHYKEQTDQVAKYQNYIVAIKAN